MTVPLIVLAVFAVLLGFIGTPAWPWFHGYLTGHTAAVDINKLFSSETLTVMLLSTLVVAVGIGFGWHFYGRKPVESSEAPDVLERLQPKVFAVLRQKFFFDEIYEATVVRFNAGWSVFCDLMDRWVWNGAVQVVSYVVLGFSWLNRFFDEYVVNFGFDLSCGRLRRGGKFMSRLQDGKVQNYLSVIGVALTVLVLLLLWGCRS